MGDGGPFEAPADEAAPVAVVAEVTTEPLVTLIPLLMFPEVMNVLGALFKPGGSRPDKPAEGRLLLRAVLGAKLTAAVELLLVCNPIPILLLWLLLGAFLEK